MTQTHRIWSLAEAIIDKAGAEGLIVTSAESCTGGMISAALTDVPGSSAVVDRAFVTYSNDAKVEMLGVDPRLISRWGAVSCPVALSMARGALNRSNADIAVSVTGIAGPSGGNAEKPVGLVWFGLARRTAGAQPVVRFERRVFSAGSRSFVRLRATETALSLILNGL